jgi:hypothetical protein
VKWARPLLRTALPVAALSLVACSKAATSSEDNADTAAKVVPVAGRGNLHLVTLSAEAMTRLAVRTAVVGPGKPERIPFVAVIYDPQGRSWAYAVTGERSYQRVPIVVDRIDGDTAVLKSGPVAGTSIVTAGAPELLGAEYGVGEE